MSENSYESRDMNYILKYLFIFMSNQLSVLSFSMSNVTVRALLAIDDIKDKSFIQFVTHIPNLNVFKVFIFICVYVMVKFISTCFYKLHQLRTSQN